MVVVTDVAKKVVCLLQQEVKTKTAFTCVYYMVVGSGVVSLLVQALGIENSPKMGSTTVKDMEVGQDATTKDVQSLLEVSE